MHKPSKHTDLTKTWFFIPKFHKTAVAFTNPQVNLNFGFCLFSNLTFMLITSPVQNENEICYFSLLNSLLRKCQEVRRAPSSLPGSLKPSTI